MKKYKTEQEIFWAGNFGDEYISRNNNKELFSANLNFFDEIFCSTKNVKTILELGSNVGMNILAINNLLPNSRTSAVEINAKAFDRLKSVCTGKAYLSSILDIESKVNVCYDFVFTKGVLIHINPEELQTVYESMYKLSKKYICIAEFYNPIPMTITYRGEKNKLFKRDFVGELLDKYKDLELVDYGFKYRRDNNYPQDDITWFLLEKN
ncbi:MAG: pseudaminic acid biosynthesis-associated methylase [Candidatus Omnitrophica bacterium]|nr:pseudaminic acid biosynthesis-associated methylase [Candidatus Omnitrophota bacterium]MCK5491949.1 pseudaminic acid biosynthesis-associated methylase [Candidatus Omnitrophota bacterium]